MKRDVIISVLIHVIILGAAAFPLSLAGTRDVPDRIINVSLINLPNSPITPNSANKPVEIPQAMEEDEPEIPIEKPVTAPEADIPEPETEPIKETPKPKLEKPKEEPKNKISNAPEGDKTQEGAKEGQVDVEATGAGTPFAGGVTVDNSSFDYPYWFNLAFNKIAQNFRNPINMQGRIICTIEFTVIQSGKVIDIEIVESSGFPAYDNACVAAIERSTPFPPMPREFTDEIIAITAPFSNR